MTKKPKLSPSIDLFLPAARIIKDNVLIFFILLVVPALLTNMTGQAAIPSEKTLTVAELAEIYRSMVTPYVVIGALLSFALNPFLNVAHYLGTKNGHIEFAKLKTIGLKNYLSLIGLMIVMGLATIAGLILFIIPGLIAIRAFILAPYYLIASDGKLGIFSALKTSMQKSRPRSWSIYGILGIAFLFGMLSILGPIGQIAGTILALLYTPAFALRYKEIEG